MAAEVDDAAEARRRIPDHPPYSLMIGEAIRSLKEEQGSTESSISTYIKANFDGLPWGHDRLLPYYLNKLVAQGEFVNGEPGRYLLAGDDRCGADEERRVNPSPTSDRGRGKFAKKKRSRKKVGVVPLQIIPPPLIEPLAIKGGSLDEDEGVPISCEGDLVIEVQPSAEPETCRRDAFHRNHGLTASSSGDACSESMPRRRGRPPKIRHPESKKPAHSSSVGTGDGAVEPRAPFEDRDTLSMAQNQEDGCKQAPKELGQPRKRKSQALEDGSKETIARVRDVDMLQLVDLSSLCIDGGTRNEVDPECNVALREGQEETDPMPKNRGRPSESKFESVAENDVSNLAAEILGRSEAKNSTCAPKRRGRPPKSKLDLKADVP